MAIGKKAVVITGVSTGIGYAAAEALIAHGYQVFGSVRKPGDGERVQAALGQDFTPLLFDVTDSAGIAAAVAQVAAAVGDQGIAALVNNAGVFHSGPLMHTPLAEVRAVFDVNVFGLLAVTKAFLPLLGARADVRHPPGRIVNVSSVSGTVTFPFVAAYGASKHAVEAISDGLRRELAIYGIAVSTIQPGTTKTAILDKMPKPEADTRFDHTDYASVVPKFATMAAREVKNAKPIEVVTRAICHAIESSRPKTRYPLVGLILARRILSDRLLDWLMQREIGMTPKRAA